MGGFEVDDLLALEILDSRGRPTLQVTVRLGDGTHGRSSVPEGASTRSGEVTDLRDEDHERYNGQGVQSARAAVERELADALRGKRWACLAEADSALLEADALPSRPLLGGNSIIGASIALARAVAASAEQPLWRFLVPEGVRPRLPVPYFTMIEGGVHAAGPLDFQEFMIAPLGAPSLPEAVRAGAEVYAAVRRVLSAQGLPTAVGDGGGFAPEMRHPEEVLTLLVEAIEAAGYRAGPDGISIAVDAAASQLRDAEGRYRLADVDHNAAEMIERLEAMVRDFPVHSLEDPLAEDDTAGWMELTGRLGDRLQLLGDDRFATRPARIEAAAHEGVANAALIKPNQIGTITQTMDALWTCRRLGYGAMVAHRSGDTCDSFIADLATGSGCGQIKSGAPARGERVAKYNRLLEIASEDPDLGYAPRLED